MRRNKQLSEEDRELYATIGFNIRRLRKQYKLQRKDIAIALDITHQQFYNIENGYTRCAIHHMIKLCRLFDCRLRDLCTKPNVDNCNQSTRP